MEWNCRRLAWKLANRYAEAAINSDLRWVVKRDVKWFRRDSIASSPDPEDTRECIRYLEGRKMIKNHPKDENLFRLWISQ